VTYDNPALSVAIEQYLHWRRWGLTYHVMMTACQQQWQAGMTGDDVIVAMVEAWNGLERA